MIALGSQLFCVCPTDSSSRFSHRHIHLLAHNLCINVAKDKGQKHTLLQMRMMTSLTSEKSLSSEKSLTSEDKASPNASQLLSSAGAKELLDSTDAFLFDCDGVLWKGTKVFDNVSETLDMLRSKGKRIAFVTNNSTKSRKQCIQKFKSLGIQAFEDEVFCSSFAAAMYLNSVQLSLDKKVYVIGVPGLIEELEAAGFTCLGGPEDGKRIVESEANRLFEHDKSVGAVVVGMDHYINYYKLMYATLCIRENPGCVFIATELDPMVHMTNLQEWPVTGCMVAAVRAATQKDHVVVGKPSSFLMDLLLKKFEVSPSKLCMIGDRLDTDILFGKSAGCKTLLVLSGVTTESMLQDPTNNIHPDYYTSEVSGLMKLLVDNTEDIDMSNHIC